MKNSLLSLLLIFVSIITFGTTITITNSGTTFTPANVTINEGDTIKFEIASNHNAVEVSLTTYETGGNTPLPGFSVNFGGGIVTDLTVGSHYYVCTPHASIGMKGIITVTKSTSTGNIASSLNKISFYPNPVSNELKVEYFPTSKNNYTRSNIELFTTDGRLVKTAIISQGYNQIDVSALPAGRYFIRITGNNEVFSGSINKN